MLVEWPENASSFAFCEFFSLCVDTCNAEELSSIVRDFSMSVSVVAVVLSVLPSFLVVLVVVIGYWWPILSGTLHVIVSMVSSMCVSVCVLCVLCVCACVTAVSCRSAYVIMATESDFSSSFCVCANVCVVLHEQSTHIIADDMRIVR